MNSVSEWEKSAEELDYIRKYWVRNKDLNEFDEFRDLLVAAIEESDKVKLRTLGYPIQEIESNADGFFYLTYPVSSDAGQRIFIGNQFEDKIQSINRKLERQSVELVRKKQMSVCLI